MTRILPDTTSRSHVRTSWKDMFRPPDWLRGTGAGTLRADTLAGLTGATIVLPQAIAFAAIAGLPPQYGFYAAIIPAIVAAFAGSSWQAITGPTTAISAMVFGALAGHFTPQSSEYIEAAIVLALMVGLIQLAFGLARLGALVDFVSHSAMTGFVTAVALLIALSQIGPALGIEVPRPTHLMEFGRALLQQIPQAQLAVVAVAGLTVALSVVIKRWGPNWPNYLIALVAATGLSVLLGGEAAGIPAIGTIGAALPGTAWPHANLDLIRELIPAALAIAIVGLLEAVSVARALAAKSGQMINANREIVGQGAANTVGSFFQCFPVSASFTRSGINLEAGAKTPVSAILASVFLVAILLVVAPWFACVPLAGVAGVILVVAFRLIDFARIRQMLSISASESAIAGITFLVALLIDLELAIYAGVLLSMALFLNRTARPDLVVSAPDPSTPGRMFRNAELYKLTECPQMIVARLDSPLYFGSAEHVRRLLRVLETTRPEQKHMMFVANGVSEIDMSGVDLLIEEARRRRARRGSFYLLTRRPRRISRLAPLNALRTLTKRHFYLSKREALGAIVPRLDQSICATCTARIFLECPGRQMPSGNMSERLAETDPLRVRKN